MKVVIDTNVLVSAVLRDREPETVVLFVASRDDIEWIVSTAIMSEYREVLSRPKFALPDDLLQGWLSLLDSLTVACDVQLDVDFPRDRKDAKFLACAIAAEADYFITGDRDFSGAQKLLSTVILSVAQFKALVCDKLATK
ncbi:MAG: putative toxin-antitoxin system toxin component, PIN family [Desulfuromonadales bacterium]